MMKNRKHIIVLYIISLLCFCLCLTACGKKTTADSKNDSKIEVKQDQPNVVYVENGSGIETIDNKEDSQKINPTQNVESSSKDNQKEVKDEKKDIQETNSTQNVESPSKDSQKEVKDENKDKATEQENIGESTKQESKDKSEEKTDDSKKQESKDNTKEQGNKDKPQKQEGVSHEQGVEPIDKPTKPEEPSEIEETKPQDLSSTAKEYEDYCAMSSDDQYAFYKKFDSADAFMEWYNAAKQAYEKENPAIVLEPGAAIDLGEN